MIVDRKHFDMNDKAVFEKLLIKHPLKGEASFGNSACFLYTKSGNSKIYSANETIDINPKESVLLRCGNYVNNYVDKKNEQTSEVYAVHLHYDVLKDVFKNDIPAYLKANDQKQYAVKLASESVTDHFIASLDFYFENPQLVTPELLSLKIRELILLLLQSKNARSISELISDLFSPRTVDFKELIENHLYSDLTIENLANISGHSLSSFKRQFKAIFNATPAKYINTKKLEKAEHLLAHTTLSIGEICFEVGFEYTSSFARVFKAKNGLTAQAYRAEHQQKAAIGPNE